MTTRNTSLMLLTLASLIGLSTYLVGTSGGSVVRISGEEGPTDRLQDQEKALRAAPGRIQWLPEQPVDQNAEAATGPWGAKLGSRFVHSFQSERRADLEAEGRGCQKLLFQASGRLQTRVVARRSGELIAEFSFSNLQLQGQKDGYSASRSFDALKQELEGSHSLLRMRNDGTQLGLRFEEDLSLEARQWIRSHVAGLQFVVPEDGSKQVWESEESAMAGKYLVRYRWTTPAGDEKAGQLVKTKLSMIEINGLDAAKAKTELGGQSTATLGGPLHWIADSSTHETQKMDIPFFGTKAKAASKLSFKLLGHDWEPLTAENQVCFEGVWLSIDGSAEAKEIAQANEMNMMKARLGDLRIEDAALALLTAVDRNDQHAIYEARMDLLWLVRLYPEELQKLSSMILGSKQNWAAALMAAIGGADTAASEACLRELAANRGLSEERRNAAVISLFQATSPSKKTMDAVGRILSNKQAGDELSDTSLLLLGKFGRDSKAQLEKLLAFEDRAKSEGKLVLWLEALGNARSEAVLPTAKRYLGHRDIGVRNSAIHSIENLPGAGVTAILVGRLDTERSMIVRSSLAIALAKRSHPAAMSAIERLLRNEKNKDVRKSAIQGLGLQDSRYARSLLMRVASQDPSKELREMAASILRS